MTLSRNPVLPFLPTTSVLLRAPVALASGACGTPFGTNKLAFMFDPAFSRPSTCAIREDSWQRISVKRDDSLPRTSLCQICRLSLVSCWHVVQPIDVLALETLPLFDSCGGLTMHRPLPICLDCGCAFHQSTVYDVHASLQRIDLP